MTGFKFGLIGGGVMGEALLSRLIAQNIYHPTDVIVSEPQEPRRAVLQQQYGVEVTEDNSQAAQVTEVLMLAVKPQILDTVISDLAALSLGDSPNPESEVTIISILAGVPLSKLEAAFIHRPVIRVMPNTPATVGAGISAIASGKAVKPHHLKLAQQILAAVGDVVEVPEYLMDAVTGLSGSGPAYVALMVEALSDGGVAAGLPRAISSKLALQTVLGTAELLKQTGMHPAELKDRVTSPGGTTIAGVGKLEQAAFRSALIEAVKAACERSKELGK
ncbi:pyrroline-5-carboxylate reductase [Limnoraphis robusta]|uniref:Pyrroline-5-carboxylate reductase n=1 Tax=Limnoraphis robusta CCNP1315 TaxID=3110306 RepID=A0ABU5U3M5_9CYAN|nr:pyrroline-5-carboxylate reductase [Limnoraphis robusta]MEA5521795.1 pyrroline-5-carboxylate reductase [Limnoraphis robusta CCNP1315]MEA5544009.1 pyrroline-5-carboxylate reductase [Limnoraphis robusta CCNP1324]